MKRDKTGKFIQTWEEEPKQAVKLSLTKTAWQILQQRACEQSMSRSELIERYARNLQSVSSMTSEVDESDRILREFHPATPTQEPADEEIQARFTAQTAELNQANRQLQERVTKLEQELQPQTEIQANQRQWLEAILNLLPTPLILIDPQAKRVTFSNQAANQLAGSNLSSDRIAGVYNEDYHCTDETGQIIPPDRLPSARAARGEKIHGVELNWHNPTGVYRLLVYADTLPAMHDRPATSIVVFQDISDRKQMEVQLIESNRRISNILESITDAFIAVDRNWRITYANQEAARLNGKLPEELIGKDAWEEWAAVKGTKTEQEYRRAMTEGVPVHFEEYYAPLDLWVENHAYPSPDGLSIFFRDISERKRAEQKIQTLNRELQQRVTELQTLFDIIPVGIAIADDTQCQLMRVNPFFQRIFQVAATDNVSATCRDAVTLAWKHFQNGRELSGEELPMQVAATKGIQIHNCELQLVRSDGVTFDLLGHAIPLLNEQGGVRGCLGVFMDITERKQVETALRQREQRLDLATSAAGLGVFEWDAQTDCAFWENQRMYEIFGQSPEDGTISKEQFVNSILHPDDLEPFEQALGEAMQPGNRFHLLCRIRHKDGEWRWIEFNGRFSHAPDGTPLRLVSVISDITDAYRQATQRKQAEAALRQSEERYRSLAQLIPQLVWIANDEGVLLDVNQRWIEFTGLTLAQAQTEGWKAVVYPDDLPILSRQWAEAQQNAIRYQAEGRMRRADGVYRWHLHQALPVKNEQGQVVKWFGTATDIDDQKQLEHQRDREAAERHHILQQEQRAREEAERANHIKDEFLAVLSHELRSPLNPILGWSRLLQTRKFNEAKTTEALQIIERNAKLQAELIEDLLDVSRIIRGKLSLNIAPVNLASTIGAALETVQLAAQAKSIHITTRLEPNVGKVAGDSSRLQQVVWNLLSNAIKFTPQGGRVDIRLERIEGERRDSEEIFSPTPPSSPAPYAQITVTDTGKGISPGFLPHVFDYFRQADSTTTRKFGGLGLGLAIVHHLVELHGGTVRADSPGEGQGATFTVRLPLMPTQPETKHNSRQLEQSLNLNGIKVLVVDDDTDSREFVSFVMEQEGANVTMASSAREALAALSQFQPDILLSDIGMPEMDGYMLIQQVRALPPEQGGRIKAIALTAYAGEMNSQQALSAGFQRHMPKPVEPDELVAVVASLIQSSRS